MSDDGDFPEEWGPIPTGWTLDHELDIAAEVYGPDPRGHLDATSDLTDEELVERFRSILGFDINWE